MAEDDIVQKITLTGQNDVVSALQSIGQAGEAAFAHLGTSLQKVSGELEKSREFSLRFRETIHTLHPILETAALDLGGIGQFASVARGGIELLAVAVGGSLLIALSKAGDATKIAIQRFSELGGGSGKSAFEGAEQAARRLGIATDDTLKPLETATLLLQK